MPPECADWRASRTDEELLDSFRWESDGLALEEITKRYVKPLLSFIEKRIHHKEDAEDIWSGVFEKLQSRLHTYSPELGPFQNWLWGVANNAIWDHLRKKRHDPLQNTNAHSAHRLREITDRRETPLESAMVKETRGTIQHTTKKVLNEQQQDEIRRFYFEGQSHQQIAKETGISSDASRTHLHRARHQLKEALSGYYYS